MQRGNGIVYLTASDDLEERDTWSVMLFSTSTNNLCRRIITPPRDESFLTATQASMTLDVSHDFVTCDS